MWSLSSCRTSNCCFLHLDWRQPFEAQPIASASAEPSCTNSFFDFSRVDLVVAADVAYEPALTQTFFIALRGLLSAATPNAKALVALERRINFSESLCDIVALDADVFADVSALWLFSACCNVDAFSSMPMVAVVTAMACC
jgi:hypothetical protein